MKWNKKSKNELEIILTKEQYEVTQENKTEKPYINKYNDNYEKGIYVDITTGEPLFSSDDKFSSGCGWPSFTKPIERNKIKERRDRSFGMDRIEVRTENSDSHLGHVFNDGPLDKGGLRYCINSASLKFIPLGKMKLEGYEDYIKYVK
ncbi:MAG: peptide-methionine (R)-S-oxide reductase MsrB [Clostridium sp.]